MSRRISGLLWAKKSESPFPGKTVASGLRAVGLRYEKSVAKAIPGSRRGVWWNFRDENGTGFCQTDILLRTHLGLFILEVKLTDTPEAKAQLCDLYVPVVSRALRVPALGIVVCRHLTANSSLVVDSLEAACEIAASGGLPTLHWLGRSPLVTQSPRFTPRLVASGAPLG